MNQDNEDYGPRRKVQEQKFSRRTLIRGAAGTALGTTLLAPKLRNASADAESAACVCPKPIPGGFPALQPYGIFVHHNPLNPATPLANISDPSQITDFDGFVG